MTNPFLNRVVRDHPDDDELKAAAAKIIDTMNSPGWQLLSTFIEEAHADSLNRLFGAHRGSNGAVMEQAEYARLCGYLAGLREPQIAAQAFELAVRRLDPKPKQ